MFCGYTTGGNGIIGVGIWSVGVPLRGLIVQFEGGGLSEVESIRGMGFL